MKIFQACWLPAQFVATPFTGVSALADGWLYGINQDADAFIRTHKALWCFRESRK